MNCTHNDPQTFFATPGDAKTAYCPECLIDTLTKENEGLAARADEVESDWIDVRKENTALKLQVSGKTYFHSDAKVEAENTALTKDRDEWKESCIDGNTRFEIAEAKVALLEEALQHIADFASTAKLFPTSSGFSRIQVISKQALAATEKEKIK